MNITFILMGGIWAILSCAVHWIYNMRMEALEKSFTQSMREAIEVVKRVNQRNAEYYSYIVQIQEEIEELKKQVKK